MQQHVTSMLYGNAPRESRRARERAQEATSYGDYVQRSTGVQQLVRLTQLASPCKQRQADWLHLICI